MPWLLLRALRWGVRLGGPGPGAGALREAAASRQLRCARTVRASSGGGLQDPRGSLESIDPGDKDKKPDKSQHLKKVFKEYGTVGVSFHIGISLVSLGIFYVVVSSGVDMTAVLFKLGFSEAVLQSKLAAGASTFVLAYAIHKLLAPVRISITLISVPFIVQYCRKIGYFKPPSP